jgi:hypothetical protein
VLADLKLAPRVEREGLFIRWAGKKRDIVDEVLVRELQVRMTVESPPSSSPPPKKINRVR